MGQAARIAHRIHIDDPEILAESYRIYGYKHLPKSINVNLEGVGQLLRTLGKEAAGANAANFVDASLVQELEKEGLFQPRTRSYITVRNWREIVDALRNAKSKMTSATPFLPPG